MTISETQLSTWSNLGAVATAKGTHEAVRRALAADASLKDRTYEVYLQGSYKNTTNTRGDSDVDLVVQLTQTFLVDEQQLSFAERQARALHYPTADYQLVNFRVDVLRALRQYFGPLRVMEGNKAVRVIGGSNTLDADVVICLEYRYYLSFQGPGNESYVSGMTFWTQRDSRQVINFPKHHYDHGTSKNGATGGQYKPVVRMFKNARSRAVQKGLITDNVAPSYFLECFLFNASDAAFVQSYQESFLNVLTDVSRFQEKTYTCQNTMQPLFGTLPEQWSIESAVQTVRALVTLWETS